MRFVRTPSGDEGEEEENKGSWTPAAGTFDGWPESLSELKTLDPCCGSGHFLVAALLMLTPMRMELEELSASEAVDCVLSENLHGLEIDQRCVELAAFALALGAWRFPKAGGYRVLPDLNVACCGLSVSVAKEEWKALAESSSAAAIAPSERIEQGLNDLYELFSRAPFLGSLLSEDILGGDLLSAGIRELGQAVNQLLRSETTSTETYSSAVTAKGMAAAAEIIVGPSNGYSFIITNVPFLGRKDQSLIIQDFIEEHYPEAKKCLSTAMLARILKYRSASGVVAVVTPQNWLFLTGYRKFRKSVLRRNVIPLLANLGEEAWNTFGNRGPRTTLLILQNANAIELNSILGIEACTPRGGFIIDIENKCRVLRGDIDNEQPESPLYSHFPLVQLSREDILSDPESPILLSFQKSDSSMGDVATCYQGISTGDSPKYVFQMWEIAFPSTSWEYLVAPPTSDEPYSGRDQIVEVSATDPSTSAGAVRGRSAWGKKGIGASATGGLRPSLYRGEFFPNSVPVIIPNDESDLNSIWEFCVSGEFEEALRSRNAKVAVDNGYVGQVPFDVDDWRRPEKYPYGLPEPYSDDPTQWLFHGHPASSTNTLQVAVARLLGYRWPAELDAETELATDARAWVERSSQLVDFADGDGIVCIPAVGSEKPAEDRLLNLLHKAYEEGRKQEAAFGDKLKAADENDPITVDLWRRGWEPTLPASFPLWRDQLFEAAGHSGKSIESWLRDKFFTQHFKLFHHRPFIWHIWDGLKDGFSALINYQKLDNKLLKRLIYTYLGGWIERQNKGVEDGVDGSEEKLTAAQWLQSRLEAILEGESPNDIFVRWKPLEEQPIGWNPDLNDGVRMNIRPWMTVADVKKRGAGLLRDKPNIKWTKDRGKDVESAPWYHLGPEYDEKEGARINEHHLTLAEKRAAREQGENS
ncbi:MAG: BREX-1 system adenine-specific DNA-methyltransferase PglX [bacterium]|nr:BREX-1 system adenine-specific DNA-methyltransferase PglX [bacterium]